ncbi:olfactory receptor 6X1-like [Calonectris borealis]|uniref:olfactory receptor 6X1-like n=1 Tax=Calonectris borealis TaxID=1323832 RepID=UPI003F4C2507
MENQTFVTEFILLGFPSLQRVHVLVFVGVLIIYILTVTGNVIIITTVVNDNTLHKPMYFFLGNLSFLGIIYVSATTPKFLASLLDQVKKSISIGGCKAQVFSHFFLGSTELFLLTAMSFDRYTAICNPLHYTTIMSGKLCAQLSFGAWMGGFLSVFVQTILVFRLPFCGPNIINHFYCDIGPLLKMICTDTRHIEWVIFTVATVLLFSTSFLTVISYFAIIFAILRIPSTSGRQKAFSTCIAHLTLVIILYGGAMFMYVRPRGRDSRNTNKVVSLLNTLVTPLLNPFIYTLRNKEVKTALKKTVMRKKIFEVKV